jgi:hypothetical protein
MGKVGRFVTDPRAGAYCQVTLDSGEKILVNHDRGGFAGGSVIIQEVRWWGLAAGAVLFRCDLEREDGRLALARLTEGSPRRAPGPRPSAPSQWNRSKGWRWVRRPGRRPSIA